MIAHTMGMKPRKFIHTFGDAHIYNDHVDQVEEQLSRTPGELPTLQFIGAEDFKGFDGLMKFRKENIELINYNHQGKISAPVSV